MNGLNECNFIGNVTKDPEVRNTSNSQVANFTLAINKSWKDKDGNRQQKVEYVNFVAWSPLSGIVEKYVKKGSPLFVKGELQTRKYDDKAGNTKYITEVNASLINLLGSKEQEARKDPRTEPNKTMVDDMEEDDLPF